MPREMALRDLHVLGVHYGPLPEERSADEPQLRAEQNRDDSQAGQHQDTTANSVLLGCARCASSAPLSHACVLSSALVLLFVDA